MKQGYYRKNGGFWMKDGAIVSGEELSEKLNEWKALAKLARIKKSEHK